jgi:hypothetical protein
MDAELVERAKWLVRSFDELNVNDRIGLMGARGLTLKNAVEDLRKALLSHGIDPDDTKRHSTWTQGLTQSLVG